MRDHLNAEPDLNSHAGRSVTCSVCGAVVAKHAWYDHLAYFNGIESVIYRLRSLS